MAEAQPFHLGHQREHQDDDQGDHQDDPRLPLTGDAKRVAEALGQAIWLLRQSPAHRELPIKDLESSLMPAIVNEQFRIFRLGSLSGVGNVGHIAPALAGLTQEGLEQMPLGIAIWAELSEQAEAKLERGERLLAADLRSGDRTWLVEMVTPFATLDAKLADVMLLDLVRGPFQGKIVNLHRTDPPTGRRDRVTLWA